MGKKNRTKKRDGVKPAQEKHISRNLLLAGIGAIIIIFVILLLLPLGKPAAGTHHAEITVENYGVISLTLDGDTAPKTVANFIDLAERGFYDGLTFHRVVEGFMIQGGDPTGTGMGGSGQSITGEFAQNGYDNSISHLRGVISMARSQEMDSASSQFFIVQQDSTFLDGQYAAFGRVTEGMEIVDQICQDSANWERNTESGLIVDLTQQPVIESIRILD